MQEQFAMDSVKDDPFLDMLKALADDSRLTLVRLLNEGERTVGDLAQAVGLTDPTVSHHLARLREAGLVSLRMAGNQRFYRLNLGGLSDFKRLAAEVERMPPEPEPVVNDQSWIEALNWGEYDQKILRDYTLSGRLTQIPLKQKKLDVVLRWLVTLFEPGRLYSEPEVNAVLNTVHNDHASLRRELIGFGYLRRERGGGKYWLTPSDESTSHA